MPDTKFENQKKASYFNWLDIIYYQLLIDDFPCPSIMFKIPKPENHSDKPKIISLNFLYSVISNVWKFLKRYYITCNILKCHRNPPLLSWNDNEIMMECKLKKLFIWYNHFKLFVQKKNSKKDSFLVVGGEG